MSILTNQGAIADPYRNFIAVSRYARWDENEGRRETWAETVDRYFTFMDYDHNWGAELINGTLSIAAPAAGSFTPKTIEVWAKKASTAAFSDNLTSPTAQYTNGGTFQAYQIDEWQLRTYVFSSGFSGAINFTGTGQIGSVVLYPYAKTSAQVLEAYQAYVGRPVVPLPTQGNIGIVELTEQIDAYEYEWSMESAG